MQGRHGLRGLHGRGPSSLLLASGLIALAASACAPPVSTPSAPVHATEAAKPAPAPQPPQWIEDDFDAALRRARETGSVVLVDAWAPWCHTCLSMRREVLSSPALGAYAGRVVFAALDTDKPSSAAFVGRYALEVWPTFLVIDPTTDRVLAVHGGAASLEELRTVLDGALALQRSGGEGGFEQALREGAESYAARRFDVAGAAYLRAAALPHPRVSEAYVGAIRSFYEGHDIPSCAAVGQRWLDVVGGSAMAADFTYYARACALELPSGKPRSALLLRARERLRAIAADPPASATVDDRADALAMLAEAERESGDAEAARAATARRVAMLDAAAAAARTPEDAAVFDYMRMRAYEDAGTPALAVAMLEQRIEQMPRSYEPAARLASVLTKIDPRRAPALFDRAIELSYGPRRVRYLEQKADVLATLGDAPGVLATRQAIVDALVQLPPGQADPARLAKAKDALEAAQRAERERLAPVTATKATGPTKSSGGSESSTPKATSPAGPPPAR